ncbi:hypothetical protein [Sphaerisporangium sp. TRM90804]|uniref:hypothetical protein n=1 Tax=Sphaerisporangium sp. TRM90804 TaxID=3031113 RepID=UPI002449664D|nr:hypothetical protein [Sphaerisporangium sp. TRM90804]MDH2430710.1 hypothetical protein [Sphaerisporangium sp. TRM90804]
MEVDLRAARAFMTGHARVLDRRRFELLMGGAGAEAALGALDGYRNADGGYGWGLEPDLRAPESQPGAALHAFEVFGDAGAVTWPHAVALCDWLDSVTLPDGGLPFALPVADPTGTAPFWAGADPSVSSLQITAIVALTAHQAAAHDPAVAAHPWLARATDYCMDAIEAIGDTPHALELAFAIRLLDTVHASRPRAAVLLGTLSRHIPANGLVHVQGGLEDEMMRPLDFAPAPDGPARMLFAPEVVAADLERLAHGQQDDGGWSVDFASYSPAAALEWRGYTTVHALSILRRNSVI